MNSKKRDIVTIVLSVVLCAGTAFVFKPCDPKENGTWMLCHWAGQAVIGLGGVMTLISVLKFFVGNEVKKP